MITIPDPIAKGDLLPVVSVSGGKDSTATVLALREAGVNVHAYVYADTGWEAKETLQYLELLVEKLGIELHKVNSKEGGMIEISRRKAGFPLRKGRWCTEDLKVKPIQAFHRLVVHGHKILLGTDVETVSVVGVRAEESETRAGYAEFEDNDRWDGWVWRPILRWTVADVLAIHHRHGIPVNPLYLRGHNRVGCYPCIFAQKEEIRLIAEHSPERIAQIRSLEAEFSAERIRRNATGEGEFEHTEATFFHTRHPAWKADIDNVVGWSKTARGGRHVPLLQEPPTGGCMRWGLCEAPPREQPEDP